MPEYMGTRIPNFTTFEHWNKLGFRVVKGEKSYKRNKKGVAVFSHEQVVEIEDVYDDMDMYDFCD